MEHKQRLFIYDRKEMGVLILLAIMVSVFAFTLGVHLGKKVGLKMPAEGGDTPAAATQHDELPNRQELTEHGKGVNAAVEESLNQALHDEVGRTGIKLEVPRQVDLPQTSKSAAQTKATQLPEGTTEPKKSASPTGEAAPAEAIAGVPAALRPAPEGVFTLQIGSHPNLDEAKDQVEALEKLGFKPYLRAAEVKGKGKWFRIFLGGYPTKDVAEKAGQKFQSEQVVESFVVSKITE